MKIVCEDCGEIEYGLYDGYGVAERLLEGVKFKVTIKNNKINVNVQDSDKSYFKNSGISMKKWEREVKTAVISEEVSCPNCGEDAYIEE